MDFMKVFFFKLVFFMFNFPDVTYSTVEIRQGWETARVAVGFWQEFKGKSGFTSFNNFEQNIKLISKHPITQWTT